MKITILGLSITSSWGNGHATTYRSLIQGLQKRGHQVLFLERDQPWYAENRDLASPSFCQVALYSHLEELVLNHSAAIVSADLVILGSYVPDGILVADWVQKISTGVTAFYDIDTPITLTSIKAGQCAYLDPASIPGFDLYLSFTGGPTLRVLEKQYGAPRARVLYCSVDPSRYYPQPSPARWILGYLGTWSADRQPAVEELLCAPARALPESQFVVAGPQYPSETPWPANVLNIPHLSPAEHRDFYSSQAFTLNITRMDMRQAGYSPSVRLFEAAACGVPIVSDYWPGLETLFVNGKEILVVENAGQCLDYLRRITPEQRRAIGLASRDRIMRSHTAAHRAAELEAYYDEVVSSAPRRNRQRRPVAVW